jgi:signal transduction histidine kinase
METPWYTRTAVRIALFFILGTAVLLTSLGIVLDRQGSQSFTIVVERVQERGGFGFQIPGQSKVLIPVANADLRDEFGELFRRSIFVTSLISFFVASVLGLLIGQYFVSQPLNRLQRAIRRLADRNFRQEKESTGVPEYDAVLTEVNHLAHQLDRGEALRHTLISDTSHELKTPLTTLKVQLESLQDGVTKPTPARIQVLLDQVDRLNLLVDQLQDYGRLRNRTVAVHKQPLDLARFLEKLVTARQPELESAALATKLVVPDGLHIEADGSLLQQIADNIISNVLLHAEATQLTIEATAASLTFTDNGVGVPPEKLEYLFERFYRAEPSRSRKTGGMGLGLALVREMAESQGWKVEAANGQSKGLRITLLIDGAVPAHPSASQPRGRVRKEGEQREQADSSRTS